MFAYIQIIVFSLHLQAGFPMTKLLSTKPLLICRGLAKKFGLRVSGKRNRFGSMVGRRRCAWQSGTTPAFAVLFGSNTHTLPNYRAPITAQTHEDEHCQSTACAFHSKNPKDLKHMSKMAQRACRECTAYHCGYTFKHQPIGVKYLDAAANTLNYVTDSMDKKKPNSKYHYMTHRILQDFQHRCIQRTAPEEQNLAANWHEHDVRSAEFLRTYMNHDFPGLLLLRRLQQETNLEVQRDLKKVLSEKKREIVSTEEIYLKCFDDMYGFRAMCEDLKIEIIVLKILMLLKKTDF